MARSKRMLLLDQETQRQSDLFHCRIDGSIQEVDSGVLLYNCKHSNLG